MQFQVCESDDSCQPGPQYTNPRVVVEEHHGAPLLNCSGLVLMRQLIERLGVARAIDAGVRVLATLQMVPGIGSYPDPDLQHAQWREQAAGCQPAGARMMH